MAAGRQNAASCEAGIAHGGPRVGTMCLWLMGS